MFNPGMDLGQFFDSPLKHRQYRTSGRKPEDGFLQMLNRICVAESENSPGQPRLVETTQTRLKTMIPARGAPTNC